MWCVIYAMYEAYQQGAQREALYQVGSKTLREYDNGAYLRG